MSPASPAVDTDTPCHVVVFGEIRPEGMERLHARPGTRVTVLPSGRSAALAGALADADGLLVRTDPVPVEAIAAATRLRIVSRHGVGYDNVPRAALTARGIPLAVTGAVNTFSVAEHTLFMMLSLAKAGGDHDAAVRSGGWAERDRLRATELAGRRLLLIGFGRIGLEVARRAVVFGMDIEACDPLAAARIADAGFRPVSDWRAALGTADIVSLHLPLTAETHHLIGAAELSVMKPGAILINTARGGLVDETALAAALAAGRLGGAGIDSFEHEPPAPDHPLWTAGRTVFSPHIAGLTLESAIRLATASADNLLAGLDGRLDPDFVVNRDVLAREPATHPTDTDTESRP